MMSEENQCELQIFVMNNWGMRTEDLIDAAIDELSFAARDDVRDMIRKLMTVR